MGVGHKLGLLIISAIFLAGCSGYQASDSPSGPPPTFTGAGALPITGQETNVMAVSVGCGINDGLCTTVTICTPGSTTNCQPIGNILVDTGSVGLRLFKQTVSLTLPAITDNSHHTLAECVSYASDTSTWGPLYRADVVLGQERAQNIPIQIVDTSIGTAPTDCVSPMSGPGDFGFNGILGIGAVATDCPNCDTSTSSEQYFACSGGSCSATLVTAANQMANPVANFLTDNNGVIVQLQGVISTGAPSASGYIIFGIGTQADNTPPAPVTVYPATMQGQDIPYIETQFNGTTYAAVLDTGSSGYWFPQPSSLPICGDDPGLYCPNSPQSLSAVMMGISGNPQMTIDFQIISGDYADSSPNEAFNNIGGPLDDQQPTSGDLFLWGIPFFLGKTVYMGMNGKVITGMGTGPFYAF